MERMQWRNLSIWCNLRLLLSMSKITAGLSVVIDCLWSTRTARVALFYFMVWIYLVTLDLISLLGTWWIVSFIVMTDIVHINDITSLTGNHYHNHQKMNNKPPLLWAVFYFYQQQRGKRKNEKINHSYCNRKYYRRVIIRLLTVFGWRRRNRLSDPLWRNSRNEIGRVTLAQLAWRWCCI